MARTALQKPTRETLQVFKSTYEYFSRIKGMARKKRLFGLACAESIPEALRTPLLRDAMKWSERFADGLADKNSRKPLWRRSEKLDWDYSTPENPERIFVGSIRCLLTLQTNETVYLVNSMARTFTNLGVEIDPETLADRHKAIVDDVFGCLSYRSDCDPRWLIADVTDLAKAIYEDRVFDRMPILADALMDAGCDNPEIIQHCRGDGPHVRGCWVVDLILSKA